MVIRIERCPSRAAIASSDMPRLMAWVATTALYANPRELQQMSEKPQVAC